MESSLLPCFRQLSLDSPSSGLMRHSLLSQVNGYEEVVSNEGEDDNQDCEDATNDLYVSPSNLETISDPYIATFLNNLSQDEDAGLVASFQRICYFNGADSYAILHRGNHIQPVSQNIAYISELWLAEKLSHTGETIPILEESPQVSAESIMSKLREVASVLNGLGKVLINIRAGHAYLLNMIGDEIVMDPNYERFFQQFPLFLNLSIKVQSHLPSTRHNACQVLVAVEHVTIKDQTTVDTDDMEDTPCKFSHQHYQAFDDSFETSRATFSPDGQTFCLLEEIPTNFW